MLKKLTQTEKKSNCDLQHEKKVVLGKRSRIKGASFERTIAKLFQEYYGIEMVRTPQSGGFAKNAKKAEGFRGDIVPADDSISLKIHVECKNTKTWSLPKWFEQAENDAPKGKIPLVIFHKHGTSKNYVALSLEDFFNLVDSIKGGN